MIVELDHVMKWVNKKYFENTIGSLISLRFLQVSASNL